MNGDSTNNNSTRITLTHTRPNPLFQLWIEELYKEAIEKKSKLEPMLRDALISITRYPLPLKNGAECAILKGFGKHLCKFMDMKLEEYNSQNAEAQAVNEDYAVKRKNKRCINTNSPTSRKATNMESPTRKKAKGTAKYKPSHRCGNYAILIALLHHLNENHDGGLDKDDLIEKAQPYSEESFTRPKPDTFYTAWSDIKRLITKGLVIKSNDKKPVYTLTNDGIELAKQLEEESKEIPSIDDIIFHPESLLDNSTKSTELPSNKENKVPDYIEMPKDTFDIVLLIDKNETSGANKKNDPTAAQIKKYPSLKHEYRHLKVGDFAWVARCRTTSKELVLPFIVERKRMDDLGASIKDGRFHEQKFRLRKCGLKNVLYLVEHFGANKHVGLPFQSLMQALANTRVQDGYRVHMTDSLGNSIRYLAMMTKRLTLEYKEKSLKGIHGEANNNILMSFDYFNKTSSKTKALTVTETFVKLLLQLRGMSIEKVLAITRCYKTPKSLIVAYSKCSGKEGEMLLSNLKYGEARLTRNVGPKTSKVIYQLFTLKNLL